MFYSWDLGKKFYFSPWVYITGGKWVAISTPLLMWTGAGAPGKAKWPPALPSPPGLENQLPSAFSTKQWKYIHNYTLFFQPDVGRCTTHPLPCGKQLLLPLSHTSPVGIIFPCKRAARCWKISLNHSFESTAFWKLFRIKLSSRRLVFA